MSRGRICASFDRGAEVTVLNMPSAKWNGGTVSGTDIFLSYARDDRPTAHMFADRLGEEGFQVWWDASLHSGETFDEVIEQELRAAKAVVVLWSPRSVASRWVRAEATLADRRNKLAPAIIESCDRPIIFELTHAADLCEWDGDVTDVRWRSFVNDLHRLVQRDQLVAAAAVPAIVQGEPSRLAGAGDVSGISGGTAEPRGQPGLVVQRDGRAAVQSVPTGEAPPAVIANDEQTEGHCLELVNGWREDETFVIDSSIVKIGRAAPADIIIPHKSISREHCSITLAGNELLVTDLNSTNGTFVDGERAKPATVLPVGSILRLGQVSLRHAIRSPMEATQGRMPNAEQASFYVEPVAAAS